MQNLIAYGFIFLSMALIDGVWLTVMNKNFYRPQLGHLLSKKIDWLAADRKSVV